jgi:ketosteroid isomerase-like protein
MRPLALSLCLLFSLHAVSQNGPCTEKSLKDQMAKPDDASLWADDSYFYSRALDKPVVGKANQERAMKEVSARRKNEKYEDHVERTVASPAGDMAYQYGTSHVVFDTADNQHVDFNALFVRVWKTADGQCKIAAFMAQPEQKE